MTTEDKGKTPDAGITHYFTTEEEARERMRADFAQFQQSDEYLRMSQQLTVGGLEWFVWKASAAHYSATIARLETRVKDLQHIIDEENKDHIEQLATAQANNVRLREALPKFRPSRQQYLCEDSYVRDRDLFDALCAQPLDTTALDAHVEENTKELRAENDTLKDLDAYVANELREKTETVVRLTDELASKTGALEISEKMGKAVVQQLAAAQAVIKGKDDALKEVIPFIGYQQHVPHLVEKAENALSLTPNQDVLDEYVREQMGMRWQPIETAPKDGSNYLARVIHWESENIVRHVIGQFKGDGFYLEDGGELSHNYTPTHYMPFPLPPTTKEGR